MNREELRDLCDAMIEGTIDADARDRLEELLREDPQARDFYLDALDQHASLGWELRAVAPAAARRRRPAWLGGGAAAALLLAGALGVFLAAPPVRLEGVHEVVWTNGAPGPQGPWKLQRGIARLRFASGATLILEGPADLEFRGPERVRLNAGRAACRASEGFTVETPNAEVVDLGTEFGVQVGGPGRTEVQVFEGEVLAGLKDESPRHRLLGGQAARIEGGLREVPFMPYRFARTLPGPDDPRGRGTRPSNRARHDEVHVLPAPPGLKMDGDLSDWDRSGAFRSACEKPYEAYALEGMMMFDADALYLGGHVGDPYPMSSRISPEAKQDHFGMGGSVAFRISTDRGLGWPAKGRSEDFRGGQPATAEDVNEKLLFVVLWHHAPDARACLQLRRGFDFHGGRVNPPGYQGAFRKDADGAGYTFEYRIPWSVLGAEADPPRGGDVLAAAWLVHWGDREGRTWQGQLIDVLNPAAKGWNFMNAGTWGRAVYHSRGPLPSGTVREIPPFPASPEE